MKIMKDTDEVLEQAATLLIVAAVVLCLLMCIGAVAIFGWLVISVVLA